MDMHPASINGFLNLLTVFNLDFRIRSTFPGTAKVTHVNTFQFNRRKIDDPAGKDETRILRSCLPPRESAQKRYLHEVD
jgi:hypothetical protein